MHTTTTRAPLRALTMVACASAAALTACSAEGADDATSAAPATTVTATVTAEPMVRITDSSGRIAMTVPAEWESDGAQTVWRDASEPAALQAAPDLDAFRSGPGDLAATGVEVIAAPESWGIGGDALGTGGFYWGKICPDYGSLATPEPMPEPAFDLPDGHEYSLDCDGSRLQLWAGITADGATAVVAMKFTDEEWETSLPKRMWDSITVTG